MKVTDILGGHTRHPNKRGPRPLRSGGHSLFDPHDDTDEDDCIENDKEIDGDEK